MRKMQRKIYVSADQDGNTQRFEDVEGMGMRKEDVLEEYQNQQRIEKAIKRNIKDFYDELDMQSLPRPKRLTMEQKNRIINAAYQEVLGKDAPANNRWNRTKGVDSGITVLSPSRNGTSFFYRNEDLDPDYYTDAGGDRNSEKRYKVGDEYRFFPLAAIGYTRETLEEYARNLRRSGFLARITAIDADKARGVKRFGLYVHPKTNDPQKPAYLFSEIYQSDPTNPQFGNKLRRWLLNDGSYLAPDKPNLVLRGGIPTKANIFGEGKLNNRVRIYNRDRRIDGETFRKLEMTPKAKRTQEIIAGKLRQRGYYARVYTRSRTVGMSSIEHGQGQERSYLMLQKCQQVAGMSDDYLLAEALKNSLLGKRLVYNPITMRYIKNNSTNRKSIIDQIKRARLKSQGIEYYADSDGGNIKISGKSIALIGCSSKKMSGRVRARDMYCSPLFDFSKAWADNRWIDYGILSAEYPELADPEGGPDTIIDEYDKKITSLSSNQRKGWAKEVVSNINKPKPSTVSILKGGEKLTKKRFKAENKINKIYLLAGKSYTRDLIPELKKKFPDAELIEPLSSMQIGERLQFLKADKEGFQKAADAQYRAGFASW